MKSGLAEKHNPDMHDALEEALRARLDQALGTMGPAPQVMERIMTVARQQATRNVFHTRLQKPRLLVAVAAAVLLTLGSSLYLRNYISTAVHNRGADLVLESTADLAALLLEIQELDEVGFFRLEEAEPLWL